MPLISIAPAPSKIIFDSAENFKITSARLVDGINVYTYRVPVIINPEIQLAAGSQVTISASKVQKAQQAIAISDVDVRTGTVFQKVRSQKKAQLLNRLQTTKLGTVFYVCDADLNRAEPYFDIDFKDSDISNLLNLSIDVIDNLGFKTNIDKISLNHDRILASYEVPNTDFNLSVGFYDKNTASICATSRDNKIGSFNFYVRDASPQDLSSTSFKFISNVKVDQYGSAQLNYEVSRYQKYIIAATPVSRVAKTNLANTKTFSFGVDNQDLQLGFFVSSIDGDTISFSVSNLTPKIKKLLLYRQIFGRNENKLIDSSHVGTASTSAILVDQDRLVQYDSVYTIAYIDDQSTLRYSSTEIFFPALKLNTLATVNASISGSQTSSNISFNVNVDYNTSTTYDLIVEDLKSLGLNDLLDDDLKKMTNNLKPLTRVLAARINMTSGLEENMGVHQPGVITLPYADDSVYRFEAAIRSTPEALENLASSQQLLSNIARDSKDPIDAASKVLGTNAKFNQTSFTAKFFSKNSINSSLLKYGRANDGFDLSYYAGRTGIFADVMIKNVLDVVTITNVSTNKLENGDVLISWSWIKNSNITNVAFKVRIAQKEDYALVEPDASTALYVIKRPPSLISLVPVVDGQDLNENAKSVEIL